MCMKKINHIIKKHTQALSEVQDCRQKNEIEAKDRKKKGLETIRKGSFCSKVQVRKKNKGQVKN